MMKRVHKYMYKFYVWSVSYHQTHSLHKKIHTKESFSGSTQMKSKSKQDRLEMEK